MAPRASSSSTARARRARRDAAAATRPAPGVIARVTSVAATPIPRDAARGGASANAQPAPRATASLAARGAISTARLPPRAAASVRPGLRAATAAAAALPAPRDRLPRRPRPTFVSDDEVPEHIWRIIWRKLPFRSRVGCMAVCRAWQQSLQQLLNHDCEILRVANDIGDQLVLLLRPGETIKDAMQLREGNPEFTRMCNTFLECTGSRWAYLWGRDQVRDFCAGRYMR